MSSYQPLMWDGSYRNCTIIPHAENSDGLKCGIIEELDILCIYINMTNKVPIIIDEIKPLFNLEKLGSHYNDKYIFYRPGLYIRLNVIPNHKIKNKEECSKILLFRYMLKLANINERGILVKKKKYYDYGDSNRVEKAILSARISRLYLEDVLDPKLTKSMLEKDGIKDHDLYNWITREISIIISRIDHTKMDILDDIRGMIIDVFNGTKIY